MRLKRAQFGNVKYEYVLNDEENEEYNLDTIIKQNITQFYSEGNEYSNLIYFMHKGRKNVLAI